MGYLTAKTEDIRNEVIAATEVYLLPYQYVPRYEVGYGVRLVMDLYRELLIARTQILELQKLL